MDWLRLMWTDSSAARPWVDIKYMLVYIGFVFRFGNRNDWHKKARDLKL